jgi:hypothetical protein
MSTRSATIFSLVLLAAAGAPALADEAKPTAPSLSDVLTSSGISLTGYIDATYSFASTSSASTDTFALNQASFSVAKLPSSGLGASATVVAGTEAGAGLYAPGLSYSGNINSSAHFDLLSAYLQYISGKWTTTVGKMMTLAGNEVAAPTGNTNVTRSLLFWYSEPVNHTGVRLAYAASEQATLSFGVNNGWNTDNSTGSGKTVEAAISLTPSKALALTAAAYYGDVDRANFLGKRSLLDLVATWTVSPSLTLIGSADWDQQKYTDGTPDAKWWSAAAYLNYAIDSRWRSSVRVEYLDDKDGYNTGIGSKLKEGTLTFGYAPAASFELRLEARLDQSDAPGSKDITQGWVQALYKF